MRRMTVCFAALGAALGLAFSPPARQAPPPIKEDSKLARERLIDFENADTGKPPAGLDFSTAVTGGGAPERWLVEEDPTAPSGRKVLAQTSTDDTDMRFPLCVYDKITAKDVSVTVKFKAVSGAVDQAAGIVARFKDKDNYYVARANATENNVRLYHVSSGKRVQFAGTKAEVRGGEWHSLGLEAKGRHFKVFYDGKLLFEADDETFKDAGKAGLWTKADSVTRFDDMKVEVLDSN